MTALYNQIRNMNSIYILIFFILCDLAIATFCYKLKKILSIKNISNDQKSNISNEIHTGDNSHYIEAIYLYNPVSIFLCVNFSLDIPYTFLNLLYIVNSNNYIIGPILLFLCTILTPGYAILNYIYLMYQILYHPNFKLTFCFILIIIFIAYLSLPNILAFSYDKLHNLYLIYHNYYFLSDTRPNFGFYWVLYSSTFLKYQYFTLQMAIIYQVAVCCAVMFLVNLLKDKDYKYKPGLIYSLIFLSSLIFDRYPSQIHIIISVLIIYQHWSIIKVKISTLGVYCIFAAYTLIMSRGFPYYRRKSGQSNYLVSQNITYIIALSMVLMAALNGIETYRKKTNHYNKMNLLLNNIIDNALEKVN